MDEKIDVTGFKGAKEKCKQELKKAAISIGLKTAICFLSSVTDSLVQLEKDTVANKIVEKKETV